MNEKTRELLRLFKENKVQVPMRVLEEAFGTGDFTNALVDAMHVSAMKGFNAVEPLWRKIVMAVPRNDFKTNNLVTAEGMGRLDVKVEHEPYFETKPTDQKETYSIARYGKIMGLSMEAMANDVAGVLTKNFQRWGASAQNTMNYWRFYTMLDANPATNRGTNLFSAANANKLGNIDLNRANLATGIAKMQQQVDDAGEYLNIQPRYLVVHPDEADMAYRLTQSDSWIATDTTTAATADKMEGAKNWWKGKLEVIVAPWITTGNYYLIADPTIYPVFEMGFYQGKQEPEITIQGPDSDAEFFRDERYSKCRIIFGGSVEDPRCYVGGGFA